MLAVSGLNKNNFFSGVGMQWEVSRGVLKILLGDACNGTKKNRTRGTRRQGKGLFNMSYYSIFIC